MYNMLAAMLRTVFDKYELNDDVIFDLMKIAKGKQTLVCKEYNNIWVCTERK